MSRSPLFKNLTRAMRIALYCEKHNISTSQGLDQLAALESRATQWRASKSKFLVLITVSAFGAVTRHMGRTYAAPPQLRSDIKVGIIGVGLAGLACGYEFTEKNLRSLDQVYPGARTAASDNSGNRKAHLVEHWTSNPLAKGSACYKQGQFTTVAVNESKPIGNLHFAGEQTNYFYKWQGYMEGAALSGIQATKEIFQDLNVGTLLSSSKPK